MKRTLFSSVVLALCFAAVLAVAPVAQASVIYIDFNTLEGTPTGPDSAVWNEFDTGDIASATELVDIDGSASGLFIEAAGLSDSGLDNVPADSSLWPEPWNRDQVHDYFWRGAGQATITLTGFDTTLPYSIEVLAQRAADGGRLMTMTLNGEFTDDGVSDNFDTYLEGNQNQKLLQWDDVLSNDNGQMILEIDVPADNANFGYVNGIKITPIPEPTTMLLLAGGSLLATRYRRRRR